MGEVMPLQPSRLRSIVALMATIGLLAGAEKASGAAGEPDPSFGSGGFTILDEPGDNGEGLSDVVILPDGKILGAGGGGGASGFLLARFNPDGSPDAGFGAGGIEVEPDLSAAGSPRWINAIHQRGDEKLIAAGLGRAPGGFNAFQFGRYLPGGGSLDETFGTNGMTTVTMVPAGEALGLAETTDAKIVAAGFDTEGTAVVVRLTEGGLPDGSFNAAPAGVREVDVPGSSSEQAAGVSVLGNGTVLIGGFAESGAFLAELDVNGAPVGGFGTSGVAVHDLGTNTQPSGELYDLSVLPDGRILAVGASLLAGGDEQGVVARFTPSGDLDASFAGDGVFHANVTPGEDALTSLEVLPDGRILASGERGESGPEGNDADTWLLRLTPDGQLDPAFGSGGESSVGASAQYDAAWGLALQPDGKAVIAGETSVSLSERLLVGRFTTDPPPLVGPPPPPPPPAQRKCAGRPATIVGTGRGEKLTGTKRRDVIAALGGNDRIAAAAGNDLICAGAGRDSVRGQGGKDTIRGEAGPDSLFGQGGKDSLIGGPGNDRLFGGGAKRDRCVGGPGKRDRGARSCERSKSVP